MEELIPIIKEELSRLGLDQRKCKQLDELQSLLEEWSRAVRLVGFDDPLTLQRRYFLEPLYVWELAGRPAPGSRIADLGSGGGTPALPMAIAAPETTFDLYESNRRKATFLTHAVSHLGLLNVRVHTGRYEEDLSRDSTAFDGATVRGLTVDGHLEEIIHQSVRSGASLLWITSQAKAQRHAWGPGWEPRPPGGLGKDDTRAWLCWAVAHRRNVSRETR